MGRDILGVDILGGHRIILGHHLSQSLVYTALAVFFKDHGDEMVLCKTCNEWFHNFTCV